SHCCRGLQRQQAAARYCTATGVWVIKVLIADDEDLVRSGLRMIVQTAGDIEVVAECDGGAGVYELVCMRRPHVVLLDVHMGETNGLEALRQVRKLNEPPAVA